MKNVHLIPTAKPSRLGYLTKKGKDVFNDLRLFDRLMPNILDSENQNIYITSNEEIKEGDWVVTNGGLRFVTSINNDKSKTFTDDGSISKKSPSPYCYLKHYQKIILTTDQDLIKDGVQAIGDEFLEWFVMNPSCEEAEVRKEQINNKPGSSYSTITIYKYEIIIPQEEPKQDTIEESAKNHLNSGIIPNDYQSFIAGAKKQSERGYGKEVFYEFWKAGQEYWKTSGASITFEELIEQFKKK